MTPQLILFSLIALAAGLAIGWLAVTLRRSTALQATAGELQRAFAERDSAKAERQRIEGELRVARERLEQEQHARVEAETRREEAERTVAEKQQWIDQQREQLKGEYAQLSGDALGKAIEQLLHVVKPHLEGARGDIVSSLDAKKTEIDQLLLPVRAMLETYQAELKQSEEKRNQGYASIEQQVRQLLEATEATRRETSKVATALANPKVSGTWGEQALQRCVELAGMTELCDFSTQETFDGKDKGRLRPDMVVRLPNKRVIAVDSKAPLTAYLEGSAENDPKRQRELFEQHAKHLRRHIDQLGSKDYHQSIGESIDITVLFVGGEQILYSALSVDPSLFEYGAERKVFIATPTVLVPLLRVVAASWRAEKSEENARRALALGSEIYDRFLKVFGDIESVGRGLHDATKAYNAAIASIDSRLIPKARELQAYAGASKEVPNLRELDPTIREAAKIPEPLQLPLPEESAAVAAIEE